MELVYKSDHLYSCLLIFWIAVGAIWLLPMKLRLKKKYGADKDNEDILALAREGNSEAKRMVTHTKLYVVLAATTAVFIFCCIELIKF